MMTTTKTKTTSIIIITINQFNSHNRLTQATFKPLKYGIDP